MAKRRTSRTPRGRTRHRRGPAVSRASAPSVTPWARAYHCITEALIRYAPLAPTRRGCRPIRRPSGPLRSRHLPLGPRAGERPASGGVDRRGLGRRGAVRGLPRLLPDQRRGGPRPRTTGGRSGVRSSRHPCPLARPHGSISSTPHARDTLRADVRETSPCKPAGTPTVSISVGSAQGRVPSFSARRPLGLPRCWLGHRTRVRARRALVGDRRMGPRLESRWVSVATPSR